MSFESSTETDKIDTALAKAQGEMKAAQKTKTNPHFGSKYADLDDVVEAIRSALAKYEISFTQWVLPSEPNKITLMTRLACGGQWMRSTLSLPLSKQDAQGFGSALTYAKRYGLSAAVGVSSDECDDANGADNKTPPGGSKPPAGAPKAPTSQPRKEPAKPPSGAKLPTPKDAPPPGEQPPPGVLEFISADQSKRLFAIAGEKGMPEAELKALCNGMGIKTRTQIPVGKYGELVRQIEEWKK